MDCANYEANFRGQLACFSTAAAERGNKQAVEACLKMIDQEFAPVVVKPKTGSKGTWESPLRREGQKARH
jgi:hypothetical protein